MHPNPRAETSKPWSGPSFLLGTAGRSWVLLDDDMIIMIKTPYTLYYNKDLSEASKNYWASRIVSFFFFSFFSSSPQTNKLCLQFRIQKQQLQFSRSPQALAKKIKISSSSSSTFLKLLKKKKKILPSSWDFSMISQALIFLTHFSQAFFLLEELPHKLLENSHNIIIIIIRPQSPDFSSIMCGYRKSNFVASKTFFKKKMFWNFFYFHCFIKLVARIWLNLPVDHNYFWLPTSQNWAPNQNYKNIFKNIKI